MSRNKCCVPLCFTTINDDVHLHRFPDPVKDAEWFKTWVLKIGSEILGLDTSTIFKNRRVCHKHFPASVIYLSNWLSKTAVPILLLPETGCMPEESTHTADLLIFFDELFDSVNGSYHQAVGGKIYRTAVTPKSPHMKLWQKSLPILKSMKFDTPLRSGVVPTLTSWVKTIESFKNITLYLQKKGINSLLLRNFNQDALENFFGSIRAHGHANANCLPFRSCVQNINFK